MPEKPLSSQSCNANDNQSLKPCIAVATVPISLTDFAGEVIFNQAQPDFPPDFIFGLQDQEFVPNIGELKVPLCSSFVFSCYCFAVQCFNCVSTSGLHWLLQGFQYTWFCYIC